MCLLLWNCACQIEENNTSSNVEFVLVPFGFEVDSTIQVSNKEIEDYYRAHIENYRQTASRDVEFVAYEVVPSEADIQAAKEDIDGLFEEFSTTGNLKSFLSLNSDTPLQDYYFKKGELAAQFPEVDEFAFGRNPGVMPVFRKDNTFYAVRVNDVKNMSDSAFVRHYFCRSVQTPRLTASSMYLRTAEILQPSPASIRWTRIPMLPILAI